MIYRRRDHFVSLSEMNKAEASFLHKIGIKSSTAAIILRSFEGFKRKKIFQLKRGLIPIIVAFLILISPSVIYNWFFGGDIFIPEQEGLEYLKSSMDLYALLISSIIALIGVLVTGFIFLSENLRGIVDTNPSYEHVSEVTRNYIIRRLRYVSALSIIASIFFIMIAVLPLFMREYTEDWVINLARILSFDDNITYFTSIFYLRCQLSAIFLVLFEISIYYSFKMIKMKDTMDWYTDYEIMRYYRVNKGPKVMTLDGYEYNKLLKKCNLEGPEHDDRYKTSEQLDSFKTETILGFIYVYLYDQDWIYIVSEVRRDEIVNELKNGHYIVCHSTPDFDIKQTLSVFGTVEKILCKLISVENLFYMHKEELQDAFSPRMRSWDISSVSDDISKRYFEIRDLRDMFQIRRTRFLESKKTGFFVKWQIARYQEDQMRYLFAMYENTFVLLQEISPYLNEKKLDDMDLSDFTASTTFHPFDLTRSIMVNCNLKNTTMNEATLVDVNLYHSDLTGGDFRNTKCDGANFSSCLMNNILWGGASMNAILANDSTIAENVFHSIPMNMCVFKSAIFRKDTFKNCSMLSSNFDSATILKSSYLDCMMNKTRISNAIASDTEINNNSMTECILQGTYMSHCNIINTDLSDSNLQSMKLMSVQIRDADFSRCQMDDSLIKGCQLYAVVMDDMIARESRFENTELSKYLIKDEKRTYHHSESIHSDVRALKDLPEEIQFVNYRLEYNGRTKADESSGIKAGAIENPIISMCRTIFDRSMFSSVSISYALAAGASFYRCILRNVGFYCSNLSNVNFIETEQYYTSFSYCNLFQSDFSRCYLEYSIMINVEHLNLSRFENANVKRSYIGKSTITRKHLDYCIKSSHMLLDDLIEASKTDKTWEEYLSKNKESISLIDSKQ